MCEYPLLSEAELEEKPIFGSLAEAREDPKNAYTLELLGEAFFPDEFEEALQDLPRLQVLIIQGNPDFTEIPAGIAELQNLQYLEVRECPLELVAEELGECQLLGGLVLADVRPLAELPARLGQLERLEYVEISGSEISQLPDAAANWKAVTELNLMNNKIHRFPAAISGLESLVTLRMYGNYAMYVGPEIMRAANLRVFDHGTINFRNTTQAEIKAARPALVLNQITTHDPVKVLEED